MTKSTSLIYSTVTQLASALRAGATSSEEIVQAHLERLISVNRLLNAVIQIAPDSAIAQAREADAALARGEPVGPLHGIPFTVKDVYPIIDSARLVDVTGLGSRVDTALKEEAVVVKRLRDAGAIPIAMTRATWWSDREERYGPAHNPYVLSREPGGSSGGEAALIAAGGSPLGMGSDSGGSLRIPAHYCGIATLRPSNGRVPRGIDAAGTNDPRTVAGPLARSVGDLVLAMRAISGVDFSDPTTIPLAPIDVGGASVKGRTVGVFTDNGLCPPTQEAVDAVRLAARSLEEAGAHVEEIAPPAMDEGWQITLDYWHYCGEVGELKKYFEFLERWDRYRIAVSQIMHTVDLLVCPVEAYPAPPPEPKSTLLCCSYTAPFSLVGLPCAVVRAGTSPEGLPIGVQIVGAPWRDGLALAAADCVEKSCGGWQPPAI